MVYVVTSGCYSDYGIAAVFTTRALADRYVEAHGGEDADIRVEEYETDPDGAWSRPGVFAYRVRMNAAGDTSGDLDDGRGVGGVWSHEDVITPEEEGVVSVYHVHHAGECGDWCLRMVAHVYARDPQHAIKIANERRTATIAAGLWDRLERNGWRKIAMGPPMVVVPPKGRVDDFAPGA